MDERDVLAERFDAERGRLRAVAYRMLGSLTEAEDAVQEAWLRLARSDNSAIENLSGWPVRRSRNGSASNNGNALRP
jgi:RNA polymerase sigma-70 factor (ECF subfamily)